MTEGLDVLVQEVIAAMTTWPWSRVAGPPGSSTSTGRWGQLCWQVQPQGA